MATQQEYTAVANALLHILDNYIVQSVPTEFGYQQRALAAMPGVAGNLAKIGVDTLDAYRKAHASPAVQGKATHEGFRPLEHLPEHLP